MKDQIINHLFYMGDLQVYGKGDSESEDLLKSINNCRDDVGMESELDKSAKSTSKSGKMVEKITVKLNLDTIIKELVQEELCKYLEMDEGYDIQHANMRKIRF